MKKRLTASELLDLYDSLVRIRVILDSDSSIGSELGCHEINVALEHINNETGRRAREELRAARTAPGVDPGLAIAAGAVDGS